MPPIRDDDAARASVGRGDRGHRRGELAPGRGDDDEVREAVIDYLEELDRAF